MKNVTIGKQIWMAENLNVDKFCNGDPIIYAKTDEEWERASANKQPAWCYNDHNPTNGDKYGKLYNWYAVNDKRGLAPIGYHIPSDTEWSQLTDYLGGEDIAGTKLKSASNWLDDGFQSVGTNESGFSALPGGQNYYDVTQQDEEELFFEIDSAEVTGYWWSSSENSINDSWGRKMSCSDGCVIREIVQKRHGLSVRCLRD